MTKTVTIDVPIEVRKIEPDAYQYGFPDDGWSAARPGSVWREASSHGARAIVKAIDSGAFVDPLPTAEGAHIYNPALKAHFFRADSGDRCWGSTRQVKGVLWHTAEQVQSYGPFEVLYDPEKKEG